MKHHIATDGRSANEDFWKLSGVLTAKRFPHTPFLVFVEHNLEDQVLDQVVIVDKIDDLLAYPSDTLVMKQWGGQWRSDFFHFSVGDVRQAMKDYGSRV